MTPFRRPSGQEAIVAALLLMIALLPISIGCLESSIGLLLVVWCAVNVSAWRRTRTLVPASWPAPPVPLTVFLVWCTVSVVFSTFPSLSVDGFMRKTLEYVWVYWVVAIYLERVETARRSFIALAIGATVMVGDAAYQYVVGHDFLRGFPRYANNLTASFHNSNDFAGYLAVVALILLGMASLGAGSRRLRWWFGLVGLGAWGALLYTDAAGAMLGFYVGLAVLAWQVWRVRHRVGRWLVLGWVGVAAICWAAVLVTVTLRTLQPSARIESQDISRHYWYWTDTQTIGASAPAATGRSEASAAASTGFAGLRERLRQRILHGGPGAAHRYFIWTSAVAMIRERPWTGQGLNTFMANYMRFWVGGERTPQYAHNCFLQLAAEIGLPGLVAFLAFLVVVGRHVGRAIARTTEVSVRAMLISGAAAWAAYVVHSAVDTNLYDLQLAVLFWWLTGALTGLARHANA